jgi:hypothetical protein
MSRFITVIIVDHRQKQVSFQECSEERNTARRGGPFRVVRAG